MARPTGVVGRGIVPEATRPATPEGARGAASASSGSAPFSPPHVTLPKGGGALRGIGEKFSANPVTGTGSIVVPIALSRARSGFGPDLALSYDSGSGNGPFGLGWHLALPAITRRTDRGLPRYDDTAESDVFILAGAEDLVPALIRRDERWIPDEIVREGHVVKRYRPRVEGSFVRIERWSRPDGDVHWRSFSRDNVMTVYGDDAGSRIADPGDPRRIYSWLISRSYDATGNAIVYGYVAEDDHGVDLAHPNERNRVRCAGRYPKFIRYGNRRPHLLDAAAESFRRCHLEDDESDTARWMFEVVFDYGEGHYREEEPDERARVFAAATATAQSDRRWPLRRDPFSSYRSGFEVRTQRLCRRILMFHHFPGELGAGETLVRSTDITYRETPVASFVTQVTQAGYAPHRAGGLLHRTLPPLEFTYAVSPLEDPGAAAFRVERVTRPKAVNLPEGVDGSRYRWVDLDGEGISGVLSEHGRDWYYQANRGGGRFDAARPVTPQPSLAALNGGRQQLLDVAGDGRLQLVDFGAPAGGYYERTADRGWKPFRAFDVLPRRDWNDPNLKFIDVTGDGLADVVVTEDETFTWHPSLARRGFGEAVRVHVPLDEEHGPRVVFADAMQSIYVADMAGDGLNDVVRVRNGEVCYWPNLGYGRFGAKVTMDRAPWFEEPDAFDQRRVRLADTDGSGTTDIVYLARDGVHVYLNEAGNGWSCKRELPGFPAITDRAAVSVIDLLGRGTSCLVWSSALPGDAAAPLRYVDLMCGRKPHLLTEMRNNLGAETKLAYASSTEFYLADKAAGTPWVTRLAFPVHVVERVETYDRVARNRFVTRYAYHHGYYDAPEREFRGFGLVERYDTETFASRAEGNACGAGDNVDAATHLPPVLTKTWFHTGAYADAGRITRQYEREYYLGEAHLGDTQLPPGGLPDAVREACRALKGSLLREELYALDGTEAEPRPYSVVEHTYAVRRVQPRARNLHAVYFAHARESVTLAYERALYDAGGARRADPRIGHALTLEVDDFGNVLQSVEVGYGRRYADRSPVLSDAERATQARSLATLTQTAYTNAVLEPDAYRTPVVADAKGFELYNLVETAGASRGCGLLDFDMVRAAVADANGGTRDLPFADAAGAGVVTNAVYRRLLTEHRTVYRSGRLERLLPLGRLDALALPGASYGLAFTPEILSVYHRARDEGAPEPLLADAGAVLRDAGYVELDADERWWTTSGAVFYSAGENDSPDAELGAALRGFYLPRRYHDPFGNVTAVRYDRHRLLPARTRDALGNVVTVENDYRVLEPRRSTDPNGNRSEVAFDALGFVAGVALAGKSSERTGDSLDGFDADLDDATVVAYVRDPLRDPHAILQGATSRIVYDLFGFLRDGAQSAPAFAATLARETHVSELAPGEATNIRHEIAYSDGFGRVAQTKHRAAPGELADGGSAADPRWIGSGWTIYNNKGKPVRQYEPFFSAAHRFEYARATGVSPILIYDPLERVIATLQPNHTYQKVVHDPWRIETWDANDTVLLDPSQDPDVAAHVSRLPPGEYAPTWFGRRIDGSRGRKEREAAEKAAVHAATPSTAFVDVLARPFSTVDFNRFDDGGRVVEEHYRTRLVLDVQGNQHAVVDALGRTIAAYAYDHAARHIHTSSPDSGKRWTLDDATGTPLRSWDGRGYCLRFEHDDLRRPAALYVQAGAAHETLAERTVYGESRTEARETNARGRVWQQYDAAGVATNERHDFKGNVVHAARRLTAGHEPPDWSGRPELQEGTFATQAAYDALDRIAIATSPDGSSTRYEYDETGNVRAVGVRFDGESALTSFVGHVAYNARGQRVSTGLANGTTTTCVYDPETFALDRLRTVRAVDGAVLQDLRYVYDPIGNISSTRDAAQQTMYYANAVVPAGNEYVYDAVYRLVSATGREHRSRSAFPQTRAGEGPALHAPLPGDGRAMRRYRELYAYDAVGNPLALVHEAQGGNWTRTYAYAVRDGLPQGNRLVQTTIGSVAEPYAYDPNGNMIRMPHLRALGWDARDRLASAQQQARGRERAEHETYASDSAGSRLRKQSVRSDGTVRRERAYLGSFELFREYGAGGAMIVERQTLHVMLGEHRVALVDRTTRDERERPQLGRTVRYQLTDRLGSASVETDEAGSVISYEEFAPFGATTYRSGRSVAEAAAKRYRHLGDERDDVTGFDCHGVRYYASWLARWTSADPAGLVDGTNSYTYGRNNPVRLSDRNGMQTGEGSDYEVFMNDLGSPPWMLPGYGGAMVKNFEQTATKTETPAVPVSAWARMRASDSRWSRILWNAQQIQRLTVGDKDNAVIEQVASGADGESKTKSFAWNRKKAFSGAISGEKFAIEGDNNFGTGEGSLAGHIWTGEFWGGFKAGLYVGGGYNTVEDQGQHITYGSGSVIGAVTYEKKDFSSTINADYGYAGMMEFPHVSIPGASRVGGTADVTQKFLGGTYGASFGMNVHNTSGDGSSVREFGISSVVSGNVKLPFIPMLNIAVGVNWLKQTERVGQLNGPPMKHVGDHAEFMFKLGMTIGR